MKMTTLASLTGLAVATFVMTAPASALTMAECSAKYNAAKTGGTLNGQTWNQFRKAQCGTDASAAASSTATSSTTAPKKTMAAGATTTATASAGLTMAQCSAKYQAAKTGGTLKGQTWNQFRKAQCGAGASDDDTVPASDEANYTADPAAPSMAVPKGVTFPTAVAKKYASETPGKARMHTCLDQYYADKDANSLSGLHWIQKGGGFYSMCNAKLKG